MSFCLVLVVYRVPEFFLHFYTKIQEHKIKVCFLYQKWVVQGSRVLKSSLFICFYHRSTCIYELLFSAGGL